MSHVAHVEVYVTDLDVLDAACKRLGLELQRDKTEWCWWGNDVGDSDLAQGFNRSQFGRGDHAIKVAGTNPRMGSVGPWEIGLVKRPDGQPGWALLYDQFGMHGRMLEAAAGSGLSKLKRELAVESAKAEMYRMGYQVYTVDVNGETQVIGEKA